MLRLLGIILSSLIQNEDGTWRFPINEMGEECSFPIDPLLLIGAPIGQYHCPYCGGMQIAGTPHLDHDY